jgi:hypothetical protein
MTLGAQLMTLEMLQLVATFMIVIYNYHLQLSYFYSRAHRPRKGCEVLHLGILQSYSQMLEKAVILCTNKDLAHFQR